MNNASEAPVERQRQERNEENVRELNPRNRSSWRVWLRRVLLLVPLSLVVAALLNEFGQRPVTTAATAPAATLTVYAPVDGRSGLIYAARFRIDARRELKQATLILDSGWAEGYSTSTRGSISAFSAVPARAANSTSAFRTSWTDSTSPAGGAG